MLGIATRLGAAGILCTMLVAAVVIHADDPWAKKEFALLYAIPALTLLISGPGRFELGSKVRALLFRKGGPLPL